VIYYNSQQESKREKSENLLRICTFRTPLHITDTGYLLSMNAGRENGDRPFLHLKNLYEKEVC